MRSNERLDTGIVSDNDDWEPQAHRPADPSQAESDEARAAVAEAVLERAGRPAVGAIKIMEAGVGSLPTD